MATTEAQKRAMKKYYARTKAETRAYMLRFNREKDADVIAKMDAAASKADYIRQLIRKHG